MAQCFFGCFLTKWMIWQSECTCCLANLPSKEDWCCRNRCSSGNFSHLQYTTDQIYLCSWPSGFLCCEERVCSVWLDGQPLEIRSFQFFFFIMNNGSHCGLLESQSRTICLLSSLRYVHQHHSVSEVFRQFLSPHVFFSSDMYSQLWLWVDSAIFPMSSQVYLNGFYCGECPERKAKVTSCPINPPVPWCRMV